MNRPRLHPSDVSAGLSRFCRHRVDSLVLPSDRNWLIGSSTFGGVPLDYDLIVEGYRSAERVRTGSSSATFLKRLVQLLPRRV
jgi:hypothetical protein